MPINNPGDNSYSQRLTPFKYWCQTVLPTEYDDSLSYYELLNKVVTKLNEVIQYSNDTAAFVENAVQVMFDYKGEIQTAFELLQGNFDTLQENFDTLQGYVDNYFDNLDVQQEINNKLDEMALDGTLTNIFSSESMVENVFAPIISAWLAEHVEPTSPAVDDTLTISGAAADSKTVGDKFDESFQKRTIQPTATSAGDLDTLTENGFCFLVTDSTYDHEPWESGTHRFITIYRYSSSAIYQIGYISSTGECKIRYYNGSTWSDWASYPNLKYYLGRITVTAPTAPTTLSVNTFTETGYYPIPYNHSTIVDLPPDAEANDRLCVNVYKYGANSIYQTCLNATKGEVSIRFYTSNNWSDWKSYPNMDYVISRKLLTVPASPDVLDIDTINIAGYYFVPQDISRITNLPWDIGRMLLIVYRYGVATVYQECVNVSLGYVATRMFTNNEWSEWKRIGDKNTLLYSNFIPAKSSRFIYGKGNMWDYRWNTIESYTAAGQDPLCWGMTGDVQWCATANKYYMYHNEKIKYVERTIDGNSYFVSYIDDNYSVGYIESKINDLTDAEIEKIRIVPSENTLEPMYSIPAYEDYVGICRKYGKVCIAELKRGAVGSETTHGNQWTNIGHTSDLNNLIDYALTLGMKNSFFVLSAGTDIQYINQTYPDVGGIRFNDGDITEAMLTQAYKYPQCFLMGREGSLTSEQIAKAHNIGTPCIGFSGRPQTSAMVNNMLNLNLDAIVLYSEPPTI